MQLLRNMNCLLEAHPQSRRRHLAWHTPIIVPVYPQALPWHTLQRLRLLNPVPPAMLPSITLGKSGTYLGSFWPLYRHRMRILLCTWLVSE